MSVCVLTESMCPGPEECLFVYQDLCVQVLRNVCLCIDIIHVFVSRGMSVCVSGLVCSGHEECLFVF